MSRRAAALASVWLPLLVTWSAPPCGAVDGAATYPQRSVTVICPWAAGGGTDRVSRFWADALQKEFGKPFVVVNRTGGSGAVGHFSGAHAEPDGHTIAVITFELCTMHRMRISKLTYRDYECLLQMNADPAALLVRNDAPWSSLQQWLDDVRANPGNLKMSGTATGGAWDLARAGLLRAAGLPVPSVIWVPHQGAAPSLVELMGGHLDAVCCSVPEAAAQIEGGELRVLAVMADERLADFPDLPTAKEQGVDWIAVGWRGLALPKGTRPEVIRILEQKCRAIAESDAYSSFMRQNGFGIKLRGPREFTEFLQLQDEQWNRVVQAAGYDRGLTGNHDPGPLALPIVLGFCLAAGGLLEAAGAVRRRARRGTATTSDAARGARPVWKLLPIVAAMLAYLVAIPWAGFALSTVAFVTIVVWRLGARWWSALLTSLLIVFVVWLLFVVVFRVQLPAGVLGLPF